MAHVLFLLDRAAKGPQERPRFHDNINSSLGEDAEVEFGMQGTGGRCRSVEGGQRTRTRGEPCSMCSLSVSSGWAQTARPSGQAEHWKRAQRDVPLRGHLLLQGPQPVMLPAAGQPSSPAGAPSTQHPSPLSSTCPSAVLTPAATTQHDHR